MAKKKSVLEECIEYVNDMPPGLDSCVRKKMLRGIKAVEVATKTVSKKVSGIIQDKRTKEH